LAQPSSASALVRISARTVWESSHLRKDIFSPFTLRLSKGASRPQRHTTAAAVTYSSRCTVSGENAGRHTAIYSAPSASGVL
jgi:hypothetical protein